MLLMKLHFTGWKRNYNTPDMKYIVYMLQHNTIAAVTVLDAFMLSDELHAYETAKATAEAEGKSRFDSHLLFFALFTFIFC